MHKLKQSQFFLFDLIIAFFIIIGISGLAISMQTSQTQKEEIYKQNLKIIEDLTQTKIKNLNNQYIVKLFELKKINNLDFSIAQQIASFYHQGQLQYAKNLTKSYTYPLIKNKINCQITINKTLIYNSTKGNQLKNAQNIFVLKRSILGFYDNKNLFGPYELEIKTWQ